MNNSLMAYKTLARKELIRVFRIWPQTILPSVITIVLYFLIFGKLIGSQIKPIDGYSYMQYIVPGLIIMPVITNCYMNAGFSFFAAKFSKSVEELLVSPMSNHAILWGYLSGSMSRGVIVSVVITLVSLLFSHLHIHNIWLVLVMMILTAGMFSVAGFINGIFAKKWDDTSIVPTFLLTPLTYLGGVFYAVHQLPTWAQYLSKINPVFYIINGFRMGFLGVGGVNIWVAMGVIAGLFIMLYCWAIHLLRTSHDLRS